MIPLWWEPNYSHLIKLLGAWKDSHHSLTGDCRPVAMADSHSLKPAFAKVAGDNEVKGKITHRYTIYYTHTTARLYIYILCMIYAQTFASQNSESIFFGPFSEDSFTQQHSALRSAEVATATVAPIYLVISSKMIQPLSALSLNQHWYMSAFSTQYIHH